MRTISAIGREGPVHNRTTTTTRTTATNGPTETRGGFLPSPAAEDVAFV